jgi:hypothetical protein
MNKFLEQWDRNDIIKYIDEFNELYTSRPIKDNNGGMKSAHMFPSWYIIKKLKPKYLIESGVWKGLGTWFFEQASPTTKIISIDPSPSFRIYTSSSVTYQTEDFLKTDWSKIPTSETMIFFDDHQNFLERLKYAQSQGFKIIMTEDNYPYQQGDCYTPKKILANRDYVIDVNGKKNWVNKKDEDLEFFTNNVKIYQEMPPLFKSELTRWGDNWDNNYPTPEPLLTIIDKLKYPEFYSEKKDYTWICYLELI